MRSGQLRLAVSLVVAAFAVSSHALGADCANPRKASGTMSEGVYNGVQEATELLAQNKHGDAISKLTKLSSVGSDFEKAVVGYNLGFAYTGREDYANATKAFAAALALNSLPQQQHEQLQYNLGQLYIAAEKRDEGIKTLQAYVTEACGEVPADAHIFLANVLSQAHRYDEALPQIDKAIAKSKSPKETWLQLKLAIHYELKNYAACARTLVELIGVVPDKPDYWKQLSGMFLEMKQDTEAVAVLALAERRGFIAKPQEIKNLYSIYMLLELPYKAGMLIQEALAEQRVPSDEAHLELLSNAWLNARESTKAEASLKQLAAIADRGEHYFKLGGMYGDEERWKESREMLVKAIEKGGLKRAGEAYIRLAVAEHNLKNNRGAQAALTQAMNYDDTRKQAGEWLRHLSGQMAEMQQEAVAATTES